MSFITLIARVLPVGILFFTGFFLVVVLGKTEEVNTNFFYLIGTVNGLLVGLVIAEMNR